MSSCTETPPKSEAEHISTPAMKSENSDGGSNVVSVTNFDINHLTKMIVITVS